jgi:ABC-type glycerol-3-phosphate transport system substrate-binding protein
MKREIKRAAIVLITLLLMVSLIGCTETSTTKDAPKDDKPKEIKLTYQYWDLIPEQEKIFAKFSEEYKEKTGIEVSIDGQYISDAGWEDTLKTQVAAGSGPDVFHLDLGMASSWRDAVIQPMSPYYEKDFWDQFIPSTIDAWKFDDEYYQYLTHSLL